MGSTFHVTEDGKISDGHHTFEELYEYRLLYNAALFNTWARLGLYGVHKSRFHHDGTVPYRVTDWRLFKILERDLPNVYDGHTPAVVAQRLTDFLSGNY